MQPLGKQPSHQSTSSSSEIAPEADQTRAPASAVNAIMGRLGLARIQDEPEASEDTLTSNLADPSWVVRVSAVQKLGKMGKQAPLGLLLAAMRDEQSGVRVAAARALSRNPRQAAISALVAALDDHEWLVRSEVALALGAMRELAPLEPLLRSLQDQDATVRASAARALGETKAAEALAPLNATLQDEDWSVREAATLALAQLELDGQIVVPPLLNARLDRDPAETGLLQMYPDMTSAPPPPSDSIERWLERIEFPESALLASDPVKTRSLQSKNERSRARRTRPERGTRSPSRTSKWPLKAIHTAEGVLAAMIITSLFIVWLAIETQPRSTQGQANPANSRSITFTTYRGHDSKVIKLAWSPDGQNIASADTRGNVLLWQASTGKTLTTSFHHGTVLALTWYDTSTVLVAYAEPDKELQVEELPLNFGPLGSNIIFNLPGLPDVPTVASWSSDRQTLAFDTGKGSSVEIWNVMSNHRVASIQEKHVQYSELTWSPDNEQLATLSTTGLLEAWSTVNGRPIASLPNNHEATIATWISSGNYSSGRLLVDSNSALCDWSYGRPGRSSFTVFMAEQTYNLTNADGLTISSLSISPDNSLVLLATSEGAVQTRDMLSGGSMIYLYTGHSAQVNDIEWSPLGQHIATASTDTTVRVWQEP